MEVTVLSRSEIGGGSHDADEGNFEGGCERTIDTEEKCEEKKSRQGGPDIYYCRR